MFFKNVNVKQKNELPHSTVFKETQKIPLSYLFHVLKHCGLDALKWKYVEKRLYLNLQQST